MPSAILFARLLDADRRWSASCREAALRAPTLRRAAIPLARSGDALIWFGGAAIYAAVRGAAVYRPTLLVVVALLVTALAVRVAKTLTRRSRPDGEWGGDYRYFDPHAFPSGHAARAAMLTVLGFALGPPWLGLVLAIWAVLVALSRVALGVHYVSDVVAGALLGVGCGLVAAAFR